MKIWTVLEPTAFVGYRNEFFIAFDDGYIYTLDASVHVDNSVSIPHVVATGLFESPFNDICLEKYNVSCGTQATGASFELEVYNEDVKIDDLHSATPSVSFDVDIDTRTDGVLNGNFKKFMPIIRNIDPSDEALQINNIQFKARPLSE